MSVSTNPAPATVGPSEPDRDRLRSVIAYMAATEEVAWQQGVVRSADGARNCFFGHLFAMGSTAAESNELWGWFENTWATTYVIYRVNDGENPRYPQATPKQRVLAFLRALLAGTEEDTQTGLERGYQAWVQSEGLTEGSC